MGKREIEKIKKKFQKMEKSLKDFNEKYDKEMLELNILIDAALETDTPQRKRRTATPAKVKDTIDIPEN